MTTSNGLVSSKDEHRDAISAVTYCPLSKSRARPCLHRARKQHAVKNLLARSIGPSRFPSVALFATRASLFLRCVNWTVGGFLSVLESCTRKSRRCSRDYFICGEELSSGMWCSLFVGFCEDFCGDSRGMFVEYGAIVLGKAKSGRWSRCRARLKILYDIFENICQKFLIRKLFRKVLQNGSMYWNRIKIKIKNIAFWGFVSKLLFLLQVSLVRQLLHALVVIINNSQTKRQM